MTLKDGSCALWAWMPPSVLGTLPFWKPSFVLMGEELCRDTIVQVTVGADVDTQASTQFEEGFVC